MIAISFFSLKRRILIASSTFLLLIKSQTCLTLRADLLTLLFFTTIITTYLFLRFLICTVAGVVTSKRELTKFMTNHIVSNINRNEFLSIMYSKSKTDEIRNDH